MIAYVAFLLAGLIIGVIIGEAIYEKRKGKLLSPEEMEESYKDICKKDGLLVVMSEKGSGLKLSTSFTINETRYILMSSQWLLDNPRTTSYITLDKELWNELRDKLYDQSTSL